VKWDVTIGFRQQRDDESFFAQCAQLFRAAYSGSVRAGSEESQNSIGTIDARFDVVSPGVAASDLMGVQPRLKAVTREVFSQTLGELRPVLAGVRDKYAGVSGRGHWLMCNYASAR